MATCREFAVAGMALLLATACTERQPARGVVETGDGWSVALSASGTDVCVELRDGSERHTRCAEALPDLQSAAVAFPDVRGTATTVVFGLVPRDAARVGVIFSPEEPPSEDAVNMWAATGDIGLGTPAFVIRPPNVERCLTLVAVSADGNFVETRENVIASDQCP